MHIIIASTNSDKARQLKNLLQLSFQEKARISTLFDKTISKDPTLLENLKEELLSLSGETVIDLAQKKASLVANRLQTFSLAEETLLTIPLFGTEKEAFLIKNAKNFDIQKRGATPLSFTNLQQNVQNVLYSLSEHKDSVSRSAYLSSFISFATPTGHHIDTIISRMEGYISERERGKRTFEYGSIFMKHEYSKTLSELPESVLMRISHRKNGIERLYHIVKREGYFSPSACMNPNYLEL